MKYVKTFENFNYDTTNENWLWGEGNIFSKIGNWIRDWKDRKLAEGARIATEWTKNNPEELEELKAKVKPIVDKISEEEKNKMLDSLQNFQGNIPTGVLNESVGDFLVKIKKQDVLYDYVYASHPFDVVGWDGFNFPYAFSIHDFEPITGRVHQPPPVHQTFETKAFVICSFVPRLYDYHPESIPAPYNHSNIDSDEVLYYVDGDFMSRNHIEKGQITLHPSGLPHGPHPGAYERSIGKKSTEELAVMVDTFKPLQLTTFAMGIEDDDYSKSWLTH